MIIYYRIFTFTLLFFPMSILSTIPYKLIDKTIHSLLYLCPNNNCLDEENAVASECTLCLEPIKETGGAGLISLSSESPDICAYFDQETIIPAMTPEQKISDSKWAVTELRCLGCLQDETTLLPTFTSLIDLDKENGIEKKLTLPISAQQQSLIENQIGCNRQLANITESIKSIKSRQDKKSINKLGNEVELLCGTRKQNLSYSHKGYFSSNKGSCNVYVEKDQGNADLTGYALTHENRFLNLKKLKEKTTLLHDKNEISACTRQFLAEDTEADINTRQPPQSLTDLGFLDGFIVK